MSLCRNLPVYSVKQMPIIHDVDNLSDHEPIILDLEFQLDRYENVVFTRKPAWHKANDNDFKSYK